MAIGKTLFIVYSIQLMPSADISPSGVTCVVNDICAARVIYCRSLLTAFSYHE
jgi:hypothetical protein